ncbi:type I-U CRISPR-associated protein Csb2 [Streptomyces sp. G-5]|uniref:type I-G CRISPR-associated protein Csb2 n=1 Tax=Streptomyces sp. G-5 TaxID=2977231 RepID=UPI0021D055FF|nr:type I-U CRISPR-associated protein Csb2 [Streptomyces sp. G-5]MCU4750046.1 type I-U CRISPR-associated protein Csb2 [Streptomyces sp. G-5]
MELLEPAYQAATVGRERAEWPPHPARMFCALVSVADPDDPVHNAALGWLEEQVPPLVGVPAGSAEASSPRAAWVPTNAVAASPSHGVLPGRTNGEKTWPQRTLSAAGLVFVWEAEPPAGVRSVLEDLARKVPYLGRASGPALVTATVGPTPDLSGAGWQVWEPAADQFGGGVDLRVPYPGYLAGLRDAYGSGQPAWQQARSTAYTLRREADDDLLAGGVDPVMKGPFGDMVTFAFDRRVSVDAVATMAVTGSLRRKVMGMLEACGHDVAAMPALHGHTDSDIQRPCAFLGLPFVGSTHADGRLRGVAVAIPQGLETVQRRALLAVLLRAGGGLTKLSVPGTPRPVKVTYVGPAAGADVDRWTVRPSTWTRPSRVWATALPMVLDGFPKRNGPSVEQLVAKSCRMAGLPQPEAVEVMRAGSQLPGAPHLPAPALRRKPRERPLPARHVRLRFAQKVTGPVVVGSKRNFGLGLCLPVHLETETSTP